MSLTTAGRVRTTLALAPSTYEWLRANAQGQRALSELVDDIVQRERLLRPIELKIGGI